MGKYVNNDDHSWVECPLDHISRKWHPISYYNKNIGNSCCVFIKVYTQKKHNYPANIYLFKVIIETLEEGVKYVQS